MPSKQRGVGAVAFAIIGTVVLALVGVAVWMFMPSREIRASTTIVCGALRLEVRQVVESSGHTPLHFGETFWEVGTPNETRASAGEARGALLPTARWLAEGELPRRAESRAIGSEEVAWNVYAPDAARFACLSANLPTLERALGSPSGAPSGSAGAGPVVVWSGARDDVSPVFRAVDSGTELRVRVRRSGRVDAELDSDGTLVSVALGLLHRDATGARVLLVSTEPLSFVPVTPPASMRGDAASLLRLARDAQGHTLVQRFPVSAERPTDGATIQSTTPNVPEGP